MIQTLQFDIRAMIWISQFDIATRIIVQESDCQKLIKNKFQSDIED